MDSSIANSLSEPSDPLDEDGYCKVQVAALHRETDDAVSVVLAIPAELKPLFAYKAGQYITLRIPLDGKRLVRSYSMSSSPSTDTEMRITVKQIAAGRVSSWINQALKVGDYLEVMPPAGRFCLRRDEGALVLFAAGSGITPVISIAKTALAKSQRPVTLVYANRDMSSAIFAKELEALGHAYAGRFQLIHWLDSDRGFLTRDEIIALGVISGDTDYYVCGPAAFMDITEATILGSGADPEHIFVERFVSPPDEDDIHDPSDEETHDSAVCEQVTFVLKGKKHVVAYTPGDTIIETVRRAGLRPPFACLLGTCGTCMATIAEGTASMRVNDVLLESEVEEGYILTCQARPTSREITVIYES